jgi:cation-transporting ATPase 13A1
MTALGLLGTVSFMSVSRSKPLEKLSKVRPLNSIFHPALFASLLGQFAIHLGTMVFAVKSSKQYIDDDFKVDLDGDFKPGILNTIVFLVSGVQQVTVFFVNLQGRPFMTGVTENRPLLWSLASTFILTFMFASESVPGLNRYFQLVPFPDEGFRDLLLMILGVNLISTFMWDRLMQFFFCRDILAASMQGTTLKDVFGILKTFAIIGVIMYIFLGNSDQWDDLLAMEEAAVNATDNTTDVVDGIAECIGKACEVVKESVHDEF